MLDESLECSLQSLEPLASSLKPYELSSLLKFSLHRVTWEHEDLSVLAKLLYLIFLYTSQNNQSVLLIISIITIEPVSLSPALSFLIF